MRRWAGTEPPRGPGETIGSAELADEIGEGESGVLVLERTVFYAESGGEVGDRGEIRWPGGRALVEDTTKDNAGRSAALGACRRGGDSEAFSFTGAFCF